MGIYVIEAVYEFFSQNSPLLTYDIRLDSVILHR